MCENSATKNLAPLNLEKIKPPIADILYPP